MSCKYCELEDIYTGQVHGYCDPICRNAIRYCFNCGKEKKQYVNKEVDVYLTDSGRGDEVHNYIPYGHKVLGSAVVNFKVEV
jgi:hypothetical protein